MRTFAARYPGICWSCGDRIQPGDQVGYIGGFGVGSLTCADCLRDDHRATQQPIQVCPECHLQHAGECDW